MASPLEKLKDAGLVSTAAVDSTTVRKVNESLTATDVEELARLRNPGEVEDKRAGQIFR